MLVSVASACAVVVVDDELPVHPHADAFVRIGLEQVAPAHWCLDLAAPAHGELIRVDAGRGEPLHVKLMRSVRCFFGVPVKFVLL
jgi:hypothetical protein